MQELDESKKNKLTQGIIFSERKERYTYSWDKQLYIAMQQEKYKVKGEMIKPFRLLFWSPNHISAQ